MSKYKILITGGGGVASELLYKLWRDQYDIHFTEADPTAVNVSIPKSSVHKVLRAEDDNFVHSLVEVCRRLNISMLIPGVDEELWHIEKISAALPKLEILAPQHNIIAMFLDKLVCGKALAKANLVEPRTESLINFIDNHQSTDFPVIVKPRFGRGSRGVRKVNSITEIKAYLLLENTEAINTVTQRFMYGQEYSVMMVANKLGQLASVVPVKIHQKKGITIHGEIDFNEIVSDYCQKVHATFTPSGLYNIQLILNDSNQATLFEINPRISTTTCLSIAGGLNPVSIYLNQENPAKLLKPKKHLTLRRFWQNVLSETS
jgi:carbamoyl-phosphate synthase large subunit